MCTILDGKVVAYTGDYNAFLLMSKASKKPIDMESVSRQFSGQRNNFRMTYDMEDIRRRRKQHMKTTWGENGQRVIRYLGDSSHGLHGRQLYKCRRLRANGSGKTRAPCVCL